MQDKQKEQQRFLALIDLGYTCDLYGNIFTHKGKRLKASRKGYIYGHAPRKIGTFQFYAHRFIWFWFNGETADTINHINGLRFDNRIVNLESVERYENNMSNRRTKKVVDGIVEFKDCFKIFSNYKTIGEESTYQNALLLRSAILNDDKEALQKLKFEKELEKVFLNLDIPTEHELCEMVEDFKNKFGE